MATTQDMRKEKITARRDALRKEHADAIREKIATTKIVDRLENFALGLKRVKMSPGQLKAAEMLLDRTVPNLSSIRHEIDAKNVTFVMTDQFITPERPGE